MKQGCGSSKAIIINTSKSIFWLSVILSSFYCFQFEQAVFLKFLSVLFLLTHLQDGYWFVLPLHSMWGTSLNRRLKYFHSIFPKFNVCSPLLVEIFQVFMFKSKWSCNFDTVFVSFQDLKDYMRQAGEVTYADAHKSHKNEGYASGFVLPQQNPSHWVLQRVVLGFQACSLTFSQSYNLFWMNGLSKINEKKFML